MGLMEMGAFATMFLLIIGVSVLVGAIVLRASVALLNRMSGVKRHDTTVAVEEIRPLESMNVVHPPDQTNPYAAPADYVPRPLPGVSGRGVPTPSYGKSLGIMALFMVLGTAASWLVSLAFYPASVFLSLGMVADVLAGHVATDGQSTTSNAGSLVCKQAFELRKSRCVVDQGFGNVVEVEPGSNPNVGKDVEPSAPSRRARCWQRVIGADSVVAEDFGRLRTDENRSSVGDCFGHFGSVFAVKFKVLGSQRIAQADYFFHGLGHDGESISE